MFQTFFPSTFAPIGGYNTCFFPEYYIGRKEYPCINNQYFSDSVPFPYDINSGSQYYGMSQQGFEDIPEEPIEEDECEVDAFLENKDRLFKEEELFGYEDRINYWLKVQQKENKKPKPQSNAVVKIKELISYIATELYSKSQIIKLIKKHMSDPDEYLGSAKDPIFKKLSELNRSKKLIKQNKEDLSEILSQLFLVKYNLTG